MEKISENELNKVREVFKKDRFATENGAVIENIGANYAKCSMKLTPRHKNGMGAVRHTGFEYHTP